MSLKSITINGVTWTPENLKARIVSDDTACCRAILKIFNYQTRDEQRTDCTQHKNKVGFAAFDAPILSSFAKQLLDGRKLSEKQMAIARKKMPFYANQIFRHLCAEQKEAA